MVKAWGYFYTPAKFVLVSYVDHEEILLKTLQYHNYFIIIILGLNPKNNSNRTKYL